MAITADQVKALRDRTGAGFMECKAALTEAAGNMEDATTLLRKRGLAQVAKRMGRSTKEGVIGSYVHTGAKVGVLIEVNCESDFVARTPEFQTLARELAMQIAAASPRWVRREEVPPAELDHERAIYRAQFETSGKPAHVIDKIVDGKLESFYQTAVLMDQPTIRDGSQTVAQLVAQTAAKVGENVTVTRFTRFKVGEADV